MSLFEAVISDTTVTHMDQDWHPLLHSESSVREGQGTASPKLSRRDLRSLELDQFLAAQMADELPEQKRIPEASKRAGLPEIQVSCFEGQLVSMLLQLMNARLGVEIGTLGGYSTSWICRALKCQKRALVHTCELSPEFARIASQNLSPWEGLFQIHVGPALETLHGKLGDLKDLDFVFIDADKAAYPDYFDWAWPRVRRGGIILLDNFYLWGGIYFRGEAFPQDYADRQGEGNLNRTKWLALKKLWQRIEQLGPAASRTILPTSEGLGFVLKLI